MSDGSVGESPLKMGPGGGIPKDVFKILFSVVEGESEWENDCITLCAMVGGGGSSEEQDSVKK